MSSGSYFNMGLLQIVEEVISNEVMIETNRRKEFTPSKRVLEEQKKGLLKRAVYAYTYSRYLL